MRIFLSILLMHVVLAGCGGGRPSGADAGLDAAPSDAGPPPPPERCATFTAPGPGPSFRDVTDAWGVGPSGLDVLANRVAVADIDGDGFPDIVVHLAGGQAAVDLTVAPRDLPYRVLMNRPGASGGRTFEDATLSSNYGALREPVAGTGRRAHLAGFADLDDDGDIDAISVTYGDPTQAATDPGHRNEILLNDGTGVFTLAPPSPAIVGSDDGSRLFPATTITFVDHDRDGLLDAYIGAWYARYGTSLWGVQNVLARNMGGGAFEDVTDAVGLTTPGDIDQHDTAQPTYGVTACDVDLDGDTDLLVSAYGRRWNQLFLRDGGGYREVGEASGFDADNLLDYSDNEFYRCYCQTTGSCTAPAPRIACDGLYWNDGLDDQPFRLGGNTFTTACADVDNDGDMDLYSAEIHHWHIGESSDSSQLLVNDGPDATGTPIFSRPGNAATGLSVPHVGVSWNEGGITSALADLDNDGLMDALLGTSDYPDQALWIYRQDPGGTFTEMSAAAGAMHPCAPGFALADFDRDGDLDLAVASSTARDCAAIWADGPALRIYENTTGQDANFTEIHLEGAGAAANGANRSAIGAIVRVSAGGVTRTREVEGPHGHFGVENDLDVTIGLGATCAIDSIEVRWPDAAGTVETFADVRANYRLVIRQDAGLSYVTE